MKQKLLALCIALSATSAFAHTSDFVGSGDYNYYKGQQKILDQKQSNDILTNSNSIARQMAVNIDQDASISDHENRLVDLEKRPPAQDGKDGKDGKDGINGLDGKDGTNGLDGKDGAAGTNGIDGKDGEAGTNGTNGLDGKDGKDGAAGTNGTNGLDGKKGDTGSAGLNGTNGLDGSDGKNGKDADMGLVNSIAIGMRTEKSALAETDARIKEQKAAQYKTSQAVAAHTEQLRDHEGRIQGLEQSTTSKFAQLGDKIDQNRKMASAGIAGVAAMANIPQVSQGATFSVGAGAGNFDSEQGLAVGFSGRINGTIVTKASVSATTQSDFVVGVGISKEW